MMRLLWCYMMMTYDEMYVMKGGGDEYELGAVSFDELFCEVCMVVGWYAVVEFVCLLGVGISI